MVLKRYSRHCSKWDLFLEHVNYLYIFSRIIEDFLL